MMLKQMRLKKKLTKCSIIAGVIVVILALFAFLLSNYSDDSINEQSSKQAENDSIRAEYNTLTTQYGMTKKNKELYDNYIKSHNPSFVLDREVSKNILKKLHDRLHLTSLEIVTSKIDYLTDKAFKTNSGNMIKYEVTLTFSGLSDSSIYELINSLKQEMPGIILVHDLKISRDGDLSQTYISNSLNSHKLIPLVKGTIGFSWIGIIPQENKDDAAKNPAMRNHPMRNGGIHGQ